MLESRKRINIRNSQIKGDQNINRLLNEQNTIIVTVIKQIRKVHYEYLILTNFYYVKNTIKQKIKSLFIKFERVLKQKQYEQKEKEKEKE